ncbi:MAG: class II aldolase/adducin family protein [Alicyclobacillus sp.]|nr:class II aldolase/adducin family protein [Alicyclobacillus sp.]
MLEWMGLLGVQAYASCRDPEEPVLWISPGSHARRTLRASELQPFPLPHSNGSSAKEPLTLTANAVAHLDKETVQVARLHAALYQRRPDVNAVIQYQPDWSMAVALADWPMQPVTSMGCFVEDPPAFHEFLWGSEGDIAERLGEAVAVKLVHHGQLVLGRTPEEAYFYAVMVEENAKRMALAAALNPQFHCLQGENLRETRKTTWSYHGVLKHWAYWIGKLGQQGVLAGSEG